MKVIVIGTRGIPNILGGVETHCENLYSEMAKDKNMDITVVCRSCYVQVPIAEFNGIKLKNLFAPKAKSLEAVVHTFLAVLYAAIKRPDILHIHAIGPGLLTPLARLFGLKVVVTHHGPDYARQKWGKVAKLFLKLGEWAAVIFANRVIVISDEIRELLYAKFRRADVTVIPNGVKSAHIPNEIDYLNDIGLTDEPYIFALGRFVPEKAFDTLINAYSASTVKNRYKLVIAGDADHETPYSKKLKTLAEENRVMLVGVLKGERLAQVFSNTSLFVIPSFYEGLPIALLEAMSYSLPIIASDIRANTQVNLPESYYFPVGDVVSLTKKIEMVLDESDVKKRYKYDMSKYNWKKISHGTKEVYSGGQPVKHYSKVLSDTSN